MSRRVLSLSYQDLDFVPRREALAAALAPAWSAAVPRRSLLLRYGARLVVTDRKSMGLLQDRSFAPVEIALQDFAAGPGGLTLVDSAGVAYAWDPPAAPAVAWRGGEPGAYSVVNLGGGRYFIMRFAERAMRAAYGIDAAANRVLWRMEPGFHLAAVVPQAILAWTPDTSALQCFEPDSGALRWRTEWPGGMDLIGIVDGVLWGPGKFQLLRVDCASGDMAPPVHVENAHSPAGVLDERGVFHCCHGLNYQTFDLRDGGRRLSYAEFRLTAAGPALGAGRGGMVVAPDGRMVFRDQRRGVWLVSPDHAESPELLQRLDSTIGGLAVHDGQLLIAEDSGRISAFGG